MAKKEGRLLTKKQKEQKAAAEIRRKALLASGVIIEGLQQADTPAPKKVGARKKARKSLDGFAFDEPVESPRRSLVRCLFFLRLMLIYSF